MSIGPLILAINPGSTSTKIGLFRGVDEVWTVTLRHTDEEISRYPNILDQGPLRSAAVAQVLEEKDVDLDQLAAVIGRGGTLKPIPGGVYEINEQMLADLCSGRYGVHASSLGAPLAVEIAKPRRIPAFVADPPVVDEFEPLARFSGLAGFERQSRFHALNQKAMALRAAIELGKRYEAINLIVAHMGGGVTIGAHCKGRVIDVNDGLDGEGPFSPERSGTIPAWALLDLCFCGKYSRQDVFKMLVGKGGLVSYLGTADGREIAQRIKDKDEQAALVYQALAYQVAKEIGAMATVLKGQVDGIVLTGGLAYDSMVTDWVRERVSFIAPIFHYPGEDELAALAGAALRVLKGEEKAKIYA